MSIRTSKNNKGRTLSGRSPVRTLLESMLAAAMAWVARKKDKNTGNRIGKVTQVEDIVKYGKDTFSLYGRCGRKSISINDIRGKAVYLRVLPSGRLETADYFLFCIGAGRYILTDWMTVWRTLSQMYHHKGTVIYKDCWRLDRVRFVTLLQRETSDKIHSIHKGDL